MGPQNSGRCRQVVAIHRWSLAQVTWLQRTTCNRPNVFVITGPEFVITELSCKLNQHFGTDKWDKHVRVIDIFG